MDKIRIVYMGTPDFAVEPLRSILDADYNVVGVVTVPDKKSGRGQKVQFSAVKKFALERNLPVYQPENLSDPSWVEQFKSLDPDLAVVVAFRLLPKVIWSYPRLGTFNLHASLLPLYRGAAPINWAIINGDTESGVTTFFLDDKIDTGKIILQRSVSISDTDNAGDLHDNLMNVGSKLVIESIEKILSGEIIEGYPQNILKDSSKSYAPKIFKEDCKIDWSSQSVSIYNKIRGLSPYPAAWMDFDGTTAKVLESRISDVSSSNYEPGTLQVTSKNIMVATSDYFIELVRIQVAGSKPMSVSDYLRGHHIG